jgi:hypothetical protein
MLLPLIDRAPLGELFSVLEEGPTCPKKQDHATAGDSTVGDEYLEAMRRQAQLPAARPSRQTSKPGSMLGLRSPRRPSTLLWRPFWARPARCYEGGGGYR